MAMLLAVIFSQLSALSQFWRSAQSVPNNPRSTMVRAPKGTSTSIWCKSCGTDMCWGVNPSSFLCAMHVHGCAACRKCHQMFFSQVLLETQPKELHLIDWFKGQGSGSDADGGTVVKLPGDQALQMLQDRFASSPQVNIHRNNSLHALAALQDRSLDAVYLDGDRGYDWLMQDMLLASAKVKPGGWIMGHDFYTYDRVTNKKVSVCLHV